MKIKIIEKLRNLEKDSQFKFTEDINILVGKNGSGKSTLLNALRGKFQGISDNNWDLHSDDCYKLSLGIKIENFPEKEFFISKHDDPKVQLDASSFVEKGGLELRYKSEGEKFFDIFKVNLVKAIEYSTTNKEEVLFVADEIDSHFDIATQIMFLRMITNTAKKYAVKFIIVTHHVGVIIKINCFELENSKITVINGLDYYSKFLNT
ncbi:MAG TPA: AAA family ATPase [Burkholderiales bacterium]|nr:AAA family ATPase [Burkholderiales bacterium]